MNNWIIAVDDGHVGIEKFDSFGLDNFFNIKKFFEHNLEKK